MDSSRCDISVSIDACYEDNEIELDEDDLLQLSERVLTGENIAGSSVGIVLTCHERLRSLNVEFLGHDYNTDVLSFLLDSSEKGIEGEVYVDMETARERCQEFNVTAEEEVARYVVHGLLHLAGYDDDTAEKRAVMRRLEDRYLNEL